MQAHSSEYEDYGSSQIEAAGHKFAFFPEGSHRLEALIAHIGDAQQSLAVYYYEFQDDRTGRKVLDALVDAAKRGVEVSLIIDAFGSDAPSEFFAPLRQAGGEFAIFSADWSARYLVRNHQKFALADNNRVMTGGSNVSDPYFDPPNENGWCDLGVIVQGDLAKSFADWFALLREWVDATGPQLPQIRRKIRAWDPGEGNAQLLLSGPFVKRAHWSKRLKCDLKRTRRLDMVTAYFGPPRTFRRAKAKVARRGEVRLIAAGKSDLDGTIDVARLYYKGLIMAGARVYEFQPCKLHMKLLVLDDICFFGSANLDRRSVDINVELMVRVRDAALAEQLRQLIGHLESASLPIDRDWYAEHVSFLTRLRWRFLHWLSVLDYRTTNATFPKVQKT